MNSNAWGRSGCREKRIIGAVERSSKAPSSTATAVAISSPDVREAGSNILKQEKIGSYTEEALLDILR